MGVLMENFLDYAGLWTCLKWIVLITLIVEERYSIREGDTILLTSVLECIKKEKVSWLLISPGSMHNIASTRKQVKFPNRFVHAL